MVKSFVFALVVATAMVFVAAPAEAAYSDVPANHWAAPAVQYVAGDHDWMASADGTFRPDALVTRRELARALARAFAPGEQPDPTLTFSDLPASDADYAGANVTVKLGWMVASNGAFQPEGTVTKRILDRAMVFALGLRQEINGLNAIATADGVRIAHRSDFSYLVLADQLKLHYNYPKANEAPELLPGTPVRRSDTAYALWRAATAAGTWRVSALERFRSIILPALTPEQKKTVEFAFTYVGYPYVWAGEWFRKTPDPYCCGTQPIGGFDCSGFAWWVLRAPAGGWDNTSYRKYTGWSLPQRSSADIAEAAPVRLTSEQIAPLDVLLFDTDSSTSDGTDYASVDHVGVALGGGWMVHSSGSSGGATIDWVGDGWWRDHFRWGRRIAGKQPAPAASPAPTASPSPSASSAPSASPSTSPSPSPSASHA